MQDMGEEVLEFVRRFIEGRADAPASDLDHAVRRPKSDDLQSVLQYVGDAAARAVDTAGPGYLAYIPGGGLYTAALADFVTAAVNRYTTIAALAPAFAALETTALRWVADLFAFPPEAQGILTTGGSLATFSAVVTARHALLGDDLGGQQATIYASDQAHHSVMKAAALAGFPKAAIRTIPSDGKLRMDLNALDHAIRQDPRPFLVVATAGTTNTGAIDDLEAVASVARRHGLWFHVDAAYGGFFQLTERGKERLGGIDRADSITLDPHKGMFLPYGTGCLLVRDGDKLSAAHRAGAEYLQDLPDVGLPNYAESSPELTRAFRGLRLWLPLQLHGVRAFADALDEKLDLAGHAYDRLQTVDGMELPWEPELSVVAFHHPDGPRILERVNASRRVFLSSTTIGGRHTLRIAVLSHRTHRDRVDEAVDLIEKAARQ
jgi:aromatic-L-amino-acid/L-tryptophan decarboxylase